MKRQVACMLLLCCTGLAVEGIAQDTYTARQELNVLTRAPRWWHLSLPPETGEVISSGDEVSVLPPDVPQYPVGPASMVLY